MRKILLLLVGGLLWSVLFCPAVAASEFEYVDGFDYPLLPDPCNYLHNQNPTDWQFFADQNDLEVCAYPYPSYIDYNSVTRTVGYTYLGVSPKYGWYRWKKSGFQAVEGYKYTVKVTALAENDYPPHRDTFWINFGLGTLPAADANLYANWDLLAAVENDDYWYVSAWAEGNPVGLRWRPGQDPNLTGPAKKPYEVELTVYSLADRPDLMSARVRFESDPNWFTFIENYPLSRDLVTDAAENYALFGWRYYYSSYQYAPGEYSYHHNFTVYDDVSIKAEEIFPDFDVDSDVDWEDLKVFVERWLNNYDFVDYAEFAGAYTDAQEALISYFSVEDFNYGTGEPSTGSMLQEKGGLDPCDYGQQTLGNHFWVMYYGPGDNRRHEKFRKYPAGFPEDMNNVYTPPGSEDGWFAQRSSSGDSLPAAYRWQGGGFQAVEGMEYVLDATIASSRMEVILNNYTWPFVDPNDYGFYHEPNLYARPVTGHGVMADIAIGQGLQPGDPHYDYGMDDYFYHTIVAGICHDPTTYGSYGLRGFTSETLNIGSYGDEELVKTYFGDAYEATSWQWYDLRLVVRSIAGGPDTADFYARRAGTGEFVPIALNVELDNDLETTCKNNYPLIVFHHYYTSSYYWQGEYRYVNWTDWSFADTLKMGVRPIQPQPTTYNKYETFEYGSGYPSGDPNLAWSTLDAQPAPSFMRLNANCGDKEGYYSIDSKAAGSFEIPVPSEDYWVGTPKNTTSGCVVYYRWDEAAFQAVEGMQYEIESKVMGFTYKPYSDTWDAGFRGELFVSQIPDVNAEDWANYSKIAGMTNCNSNW